MINQASAALFYLEPVDATSPLLLYSANRGNNSDIG